MPLELFDVGANFFSIRKPRGWDIHIAGVCTTLGTWCIQQQRQLYGAVARAGQTLSETLDMIFDGWQSRSQSSDIQAERTSESILGVERVYDPSTNQVYQVPAGWYAEYDVHRGDYTMSGLQQVPGDSYPLWDSVPADGSTIH